METLWQEVKLCHLKDCPLYAYRTGKTRAARVSPHRPHGAGCAGEGAGRERGSNMEFAPKTITAAVAAFCKRVSPGQTPIFVPVVAGPFAMTGRCSRNVYGKITHYGGDFAIGWGILANRQHPSAQKCAFCWRDPMKHC